MHFLKFKKGKKIIGIQQRGGLNSDPVDEMEIERNRIRSNIGRIRLYETRRTVKRVSLSVLSLETIDQSQCVGGGDHLTATVSSSSLVTISSEWSEVQEFSRPYSTRILRIGISFRR